MKFEITLSEVNQYGASYEVSGTWNEKTYKIKVWMEFDGRDHESEILKGDYNPMGPDEWEAEPLFFDELCKDQRFINLNNGAYKLYETLCDLNGNS